MVNHSPPKGFSVKLKFYVYLIIILIYFLYEKKNANGALWDYMAGLIRHKNFGDGSHY